MTIEPMPEGPVTCLFTDIEKSTELSKGLHPDLWKQTAAEHDRILAECIAAHGGKTERTQGDRLFVRLLSIVFVRKCGNLELILINDIVQMIALLNFQ